MGGLEASYGIPQREQGVARTVVVITDGLRRRRGQGLSASSASGSTDANLFAFGIGSSVNRGLIEGMARAGLGEPFFVLAARTRPRPPPTSCAPTSSSRC
jgi:Ca-activated chloride channel family protein